MIAGVAGAVARVFAALAHVGRVIDVSARIARAPQARVGLLALLGATVGAVAFAQPSTARPEGARVAEASAASTASAGAPALPLWEIGFGFGAMRLPHYRGADESRSWLLPLPYVAYRGDIFKADRDGARAELIKARDWHFDLSLAAGAPTSSEDNRARDGMRDLAPTVEFGPNFVWKAARGDGWKLEARVPLRAAMTLERRPEAIGWVLSPNLNLDVVVRGWDVGFYVGPVFGTRRQNAFYYDVPEADARAGRPAYRTSGGYAGSQWVMGTSRRFGDVWLGAFAKVDHLRGAAFDASPLVRRKSDVAFGFGVSWILWKSQRLAASDTARSP